MSKSIPPTAAFIARDDWILDAWIYGDYPEKKITMRAARGDELRDYHFAMDGDQARALALRLVALADHLDTDASEEVGPPDRLADLLRRAEAAHLAGRDATALRQEALDIAAEELSE
jgi:hypothetical protein